MGSTKKVQNTEKFRNYKKQQQTLYPKLEKQSNK